jgi:hypothetical protein
MEAKRGDYCREATTDWEPSARQPSLVRASQRGRRSHNRRMGEPIQRAIIFSSQEEEPSYVLDASSSFLLLLLLLLFQICKFTIFLPIKINNNNNNNNNPHQNPSSDLGSQFPIFQNT